MLLAGDELSHTQQGNNNTYCQDNDLTWLPWELTDAQRAFCDFVRQVLDIRRTQPVFQRRQFFQGRPIYGQDVQDITWFDPSGQEMSADAWQTGYARCLGWSSGDLIGDSDERGEPLWGDSILLLMNAHYEAIPFTIPTRGEGEPWERLLDTADPPPRPWVSSRAAVRAARPLHGGPAHRRATAGGAAIRDDGDSSALGGRQRRQAIRGRRAGEASGSI